MNGTTDPPERLKFHASVDKHRRELADRGLDRGGNPPADPQKRVG